MPRQRCDRAAFARKIREARKHRSQVASRFRPLFNHLLRLAADSVRSGYCQRAGREIKQAIRLTRHA